SRTIEAITEASRGEEVMAALLTAMVNGFIVSAAAAAAVAVVMHLFANRLWDAATRYAIWSGVLVFSLAVVVPSTRSWDNVADERVPVKTAFDEASLSRPSPELPALHPSSSPPGERLARLPLQVSIDSWVIWIVVAWFAATAVMLGRLMLSAM